VLALVTITVRGSAGDSSGSSQSPREVNREQVDAGRYVDVVPHGRPHAGAPIYYNGSQRIAVLGRLDETGAAASSASGRLDGGYVVGVSSTLDDDSIGEFFGVLDSEGQLTPWHSISSLTAHGFPWLSPQGDFVLTLDRGRLNVRVASSGEVAARLR
jgi:hypothetical protein